MTQYLSTIFKTPYLLIDMAWRKPNYCFAVSKMFQDVFVIILNDIEAMCLAAVDIL